MVICSKCNKPFGMDDDFDGHPCVTEAIKRLVEKERLAAYTRGYNQGLKDAKTKIEACISCKHYVSEHTLGGGCLAGNPDDGFCKCMAKRQATITVRRPAARKSPRGGRQQSP